MVARGLAQGASGPRHPATTSRCSGAGRTAAIAVASPATRLRPLSGEQLSHLAQPRAAADPRCARRGEDRRLSGSSQRRVSRSSVAPHAAARPLCALPPAAAKQRVGDGRECVPLARGAPHLSSCGQPAVARRVTPSRATTWQWRDRPGRRPACTRGRGLASVVDGVAQRKLCAVCGGPAVRAVEGPSSRRRRRPGPGAAWLVRPARAAMARCAVASSAAARW
jgi:hypothetical protein